MARSDRLLHVTACCAAQAAHRGVLKRINARLAASHRALSVLTRWRAGVAESRRERACAEAASLARRRSLLAAGLGGLAQARARRSAKQVAVALAEGRHRDGLRQRVSLASSAVTPPDWYWTGS